MILQTKEELFVAGKQLVREFCLLNELQLPIIKRADPSNMRERSCAYQCRDQIVICVEKCANIGKVGRAWSYPGYVTDRTPYGVLAHELGHYVDNLKSTRLDRELGGFSANIRKRFKSEAITGYAPNTSEWFAEMFRLFCTNANLLSLIRPNTYNGMAQRLKSTTQDIDWEKILQNAPERTKKAARNKISAALIR